MTACAGSSGSSPTTTGGGGTTAQPAADTSLVLTLGTDDMDTMPGAQQIKHFADEVATRSQGAITIEPKWHAAGPTSHWDQAVAGLLLKGDLDLAMIPSRAWDDLGVTSLQALTAPFLVTSDGLASRVLADQELVDQLTSGLPDVGAEALGLYPEGLRHPFGFHGPLLGAADYQGGVMRTAWSRGAEATFEALGATTSDEEASPQMIGAESSFRLTPGGTATGNVVFYPKVNVLTIGQAVHERLTDAQWAVLEDAADATGEWVESTLPTDAEAAETYCSESGKMAMASPQQVAGLVAATRGVVADLRTDPVTASAIDAITALAQDTPADPPVKACATAQGEESALNGSYAFSVSPASARKAGAVDEGTIANNTGDFTVRLEDGTWSMHQVFAIGPDAGTEWNGTGDYAFEDGRMTFYWSHEPGAWTSFRVKIKKKELALSKWEDGTPTTDNLALDSVLFDRWKRQVG
jgi:TRAP-type C4-dicarboxylate transport system substrate-binding protein